MLSIFLLFLIALLSLFKYYTRNKNYWRKKGVFQVDGVVMEFMKKNCSLGEIYKNIYDRHRELPYFGIFLGSSPTLVLKDLRDIQDVFDTNFKCFYARGIHTNPREVLANNILFINDYRRWKLLKNKLLPAFSNIKMRDMFHYAEKRINEFIDNMHENKCIKQNPFKALYAFSTSIFGASVLGLDHISQNCDNSPLTDILWDLNASSFRNNLMFYISNTYPKLFTLFNLKHFHKYNEYFVNLFACVLKSRRDQTINRQDLINTALELQKSGVMKDSSTGYEMILTDDVFAAQAFQFSLGGVDNISLVTHFTFLELASNKNILDRLHEEIDSVFKECNGKITFDDLAKLEYLDMVISEVGRKYPPVTAIQRVCTADTILPSTQKEVTKGTVIIIPVYALHRDENYFPDPDKFDPERFSNENRPKIVKYSYLPFGEGNRRCFGMRYAHLMSKFCLAWILHSFTLKEQMYDPKTFDPHFFALRDVTARFELIPRK